ncbi:hypothetical protein ACWC10_36420 [Streptomyces sp. NPDC001595]|uniref:hypothetical protein n=1 Tax=Streptomyces sp. NPDC001532 TaxID=3154520 RepID=UPI00331DAF4C
MSLAEQHITAVMRQVASQDVVQLDHPFAKAQTVGSLAYLAEAYGFRYADARVEGKEKTLRVYLVRDAGDAARQRAAANAAAFPLAGAGGPVPGMQPGTLTPLPAAQPEVDLLMALIRYDALGSAVDRKKFLAMSWSFPLVLLLVAVLTGKYAVLLPLTVLPPVVLLGALRINAARRAKLAERLAAAGCAPVRDETGRERFIRPAALNA